MRINFKYSTHKTLSTVLLILAFLSSVPAWGLNSQELSDWRKQLKNLKSNPDARLEILSAIGMMGQEAQAAVSDLITILRDNAEDSRVRHQSSLVLQQIGASSVSALIEVIDDTDEVDSLGRILACSTLGALDKDAVVALPQLIGVLRNNRNDAGVRASAASAIGEIGVGSENAVSSLIAALDAPEARLRSAAAFALGEMKGNAKPALPKLLAILKDRDKDPEVRRNAAGAIGTIGILSKEALAQLAETKNNDPDNYTRTVAADSLRALEAVAQALEASSRRALEASSRRSRFLVLLKDYWVFWAPAAAYLLFALGVVALYWFAPLSLLRANELFLNTTDITLTWLGGVKVPLRYVFLVGFFHNRPRVLDAWVCRHVSNARKMFAWMLTQKRQEIYVPISVKFDDDESPFRLDMARLQPIFEGDISRLLISGDGGVGKTNLACELGGRAMEGAASQRLCPTHLMLPIMLEDFKEQTTDPETSLLTKIQNSLQNLITKPGKPSLNLVRHLLKYRRLLLIVDSLSEMDAEARARIIGGVGGVPVNALIITSRTKKDLGDLQPKVLTPQKLSRSNLNVFVESYLVRKGKIQLFAGAHEFQEACSKLTSIDGRSAVPVLYAKLFVDQLIANKEYSGGYIEEMPQTVPDLMVDSIEILNRHENKDSIDTKVVIVTAKAIAWRSLAETFTPGSITDEEALDILRSEDVSAELLVLGVRDPVLDDSARSALIKYLEKIGIIEIIDRYPKRIRFTVDALSEYLASLYVMKKCGGSLVAWNEFLSTAGRLKGKGFITALRDCCQSKGTEFKVPKFVVERLSELLKEIEAEESGKKSP